MHSTGTETLSWGFSVPGVLRAVINLGNPILARAGSESHQPVGVSVDLAVLLAKRLQLTLQCVVVEAAGKSVETIENDGADIGFFAVDPGRANQIAFTAPYLLIEGGYLVRQQSPVHSMDQVDQPGTRVTVGRGSAYDLHLSRTFRHAKTMHAATSPTVVDTFLREGHDVAAGVRQQLEADAMRIAGLRVLPGSFMQIKQAIGVLRRRGPATVQMLSTFVDEAKSCGFVSDALRRHGIYGASVGP